MQQLTVSLKDARSMSGLCEKTLMRRAAEGRLKTVLVERRRLVVVESLRQLLGLQDEKEHAT